MKDFNARVWTRTRYPILVRNSLDSESFRNRVFENQKWPGIGFSWARTLNWFQPNPQAWKLPMLLLTYSWNWMTTHSKQNFRVGQTMELTSKITFIIILLMELRINDMKTMYRPMLCYTDKWPDSKMTWRWGQYNQIYVMWTPIQAWTRELPGVV